MENKLVSIIIPNYNHEKYLKQRIDSVLNQTYTNFELIILDDYSLDKSREIIELYQNNSKVRQIVFNSKNSGSTFNQWKKGLQLAKGEYIWIAESDDYAAPSFLEKVMKQMMVDQDIVLGFSQSYLVNEYSEIIHLETEKIKGSVIDGVDFIKSTLLYQNSIYNASMVVFKKETINHKFIWEELPKNKYSGDWLFWGEICKAGKITEIKEPLNYFRRHNQNVTSKSLMKGLSLIEGLPIAYHLSKSVNTLNILKFANRWIYRWRFFSKNYKYNLYTNLQISWIFFKYLFLLTISRLK